MWLRKLCVTLVVIFNDKLSSSLWQLLINFNLFILQTDTSKCCRSSFSTFIVFSLRLLSFQNEKKQCLVGRTEQRLLAQIVKVNRKRSFKANFATHPTQGGPFSIAVVPLSFSHSNPLKLSVQKAANYQFYIILL